METRGIAFPKTWLIVFSLAMVPLLAAGFVLRSTISGDFSTPGASATATPVDGVQPDGVGATATPVGDGQGDSEAATGITEERAIELAVQYGRSWGLKEFTGVRDIGKMKMLEAYALTGFEPGPRTVSFHQNTVVWFVSLEGSVVTESPPGPGGTVHVEEYDNMFVVLNADNGRVYSWGSLYAGPFTIPR